MAAILVPHIMALLLMCQMLFELHAQQCRSEYSISSAMLTRHTFMVKKAATWLKCLQKCNDDIRCQSFNYVITQNMCELNNRTKEARPDDFVMDIDRFYIKRLNGRVSLGSIPELPAGSCAEIKASEGEEAVSGKYWLDSIKPGVAVLVSCNMSTQDEDECSASVPVCNVNSNCQNTVGSFICTCKTGFTGDGVNCTDIDECASGANNCISGKATCSNTVGSYNCTCNYGHVGDGKRSCAPSQGCLNYQNLTSGDRKYTFGRLPLRCDNSLGPGWFRFQGAAGTRMASTCVPTERCSTDATGWLNGTHPTVSEGEVIRQVCFHWVWNCCKWTTNIQVKNCGDFFVYFISGTYRPHPCHLRYCSAD